MTSASSTWWRIGPLLAGRGWEVTAPDLPGHGQGPPVPGTVQGLGDVARATLALLPGKFTVLAGHSLGAVVAAAMAVQAPGLTGGVVMIEPPGPLEEHAALFADGVEAEGEAWRTDPEGARQRLQRDHPAWDGAEVGRVAAARLAADTAAIARALRSGLRWDLPALVDAVPVPVLVIAAPDSELPFYLGGSSALIGPQRARTRQLLPEERFVVLNGGHSLERDQPDRLSELIMEFASGLRSPGDLAAS